jgi:hypothetical protein
MIVTFLSSCCGGGHPLFPEPYYFKYILEELLGPLMGSSSS